MGKGSDRFRPLSEAWWDFAPDWMIDKYWRLEELPEPKAFERSTGEASQEMLRAWDSFSEQINYRNRTGPAVREMQNHHIEQLYQGKLEARGVRTQPTRSNGQVLIPSHYFLGPKIDWEKNIVNNYGDRFEGVEVRLPPKSREAGATELHPLENQVSGLPVPQSLNSAPELSAPEIVPNNSSKKRGPRTKKPKIMEAIAALDRQGFDLKGPCKAYYKEVLTQLGRSSGDDGYSDTVLYNCLQQYLIQRPTRKL